jgi:uncharacterized protein YecE (DUF72 family)
MQDTLFPDEEPEPGTLPEAKPKAQRRNKAREADEASAAHAATVRPQPADPALQALAAELPALAHLGTSSWTYLGWAGLVWDGDYADADLSKQGLRAYAQHPLLRTVSIDRSFYRPLTASQYSRYASQVPDDFRFVVKAPSLIADASLRYDQGQGMKANPAFLDPVLAVQQFVQPALEGLGTKIGALVFELSPLPDHLLSNMPEVLLRLKTILAALPDLRPLAPDGVVAVEVRNRQFLTPEFVAVLRGVGATYCLGLHPKLPPIQDQLQLLRALWPGPLVCRWNLHARHGPFGYEAAAKLYGPYGKTVDPDPETRMALARVIAGTVGAGQRAYVTVSNKAEGSAPLSVAALAQAVVDLRRQRS